MGIEGVADRRSCRFHAALRGNLCCRYRNIRYGTPACLGWRGTWPDVPCDAARLSLSEGSMSPAFRAQIVTGLSEPVDSHSVA